MSVEEYPEDVPDDDEELYGTGSAADAAPISHTEPQPVADASSEQSTTVLTEEIPGLSGDSLDHQSGAKEALSTTTLIAGTAEEPTQPTNAVDEVSQHPGSIPNATDAGGHVTIPAIPTTTGQTDIFMADDAAPADDVDAVTAKAEVAEVTNDESKAPQTIPAGVDREFFEAAQANKDNAEAEWQYDSSDDDTSSSESDSDSSDDSDADGDYEMLDPATAAKMLMAEEGGDDEDGPSNKAGTKAILRTKNEQEEVVIPRPDVTITDSMRLIPLGTVENMVETLVLIKGSTSGEYQVLESGSVLCLADRTVIGAVAETFGRVQEPLYSVAFTNLEEAEALGVKHGVTIYYVAEHSTFVFTQPLKGLKGTDASNIHDEEVGEDEAEFSDDEAERAYKQAAKQAKRNAKLGNRDTDAGPAAYHSANAERKIISYDDFEDAPNQSISQQAGQNAQHGHQTRGGSDRGRGRGGRGRGRGRGGRDDRGRGGYSAPNRAGAAAPPYPQSNANMPIGSYAPPPPPGQGFNAPPYQSHTQGPWQHQGQQYPSPYVPQQPPATNSPIPPPFPQGAYVNPAFWAQQMPAQYGQQAQHGQQMPAWPPQGQYTQATNQQQQAWPGQPQQGQAATPDVQAILQHMEMLKRMNGGQ